MKPNVSLSFAALIVAFVLSVLAPNVRAFDGTWTNNIGTNTVWSDPTNWFNGVVADGSGSTAYFNTVDVGSVGSNATMFVTADTTNLVSLTNGNMYFGDTVTTNGGSWVIVDSGYPLTLDSTTTSNSDIDVTLQTGASNNLVTGWGTVTITANLAGTNTLVKTGPSPLILAPTSANSYSGGTIISNGMLELGTPQGSSGGNYAFNASALGASTSPVIFMGGSLRLLQGAIPGNNPSSTPTVSGLPNPIVVPAGQTGTIYMSDRAFPVNSGTVTGSGKLTLFVDYVRDNLGGDWSGFSGTVIVAPSSRQSGDLRFDSTFNPAGWANTAVVITNNSVTPANIVTMYDPGLPVGSVVQIGSLSASLPGIVNVVSGNTTVNNGGGNSAPFVLQVGSLNTDSSFSGNFTAGAGSVGIIKVGTGTWTLTGTNVAYTGMTVISNGVLQIGSGTSGTLGSSPIVTNNAALAFGRTDNVLVVTNVIFGSGVVIQKGSGRTTLSPTGGANSYTGQTLVTNGTLATANQEAFGAVPASYTANQVLVNGGSLVATATTAFSDATRGYTLGANGGSLGADGANTLTVSSLIAGSGNLTINDTGTVALTGANTYSGKTIVQSGTLALGSEASLGTAPAAATPDQLTLNGGTLNATATFAISAANRGITFGASGGTVSVNSGSTLTFSEPIIGAGALTKTGTGTLVINGPSTRTGNTVISQGTYSIGASGSLSGTPMISVGSGATFDVSAAGFAIGTGQTISGNGTVVGNLNVAGGSTLSAGSSVGILTVSGNLTLSGGTDLVDISNATNDLVNVTGNLVLSGVSTIQLNPLSALPAGTYHLIKYGGTLTGDTNNLVLQGYPPSRLSAYLAVNSGNQSIDLVINPGSVGSLVWVGGANGNAWDVVTTTNWLNGSSLDFFYAGDNVSFTDVGAANANVNLTAADSPGTVTVNSATDYTFGGSGKLTSLAVLNKSGADTLTILTTNDYTGGTTISGGTIQVGNGTASGSLGSGGVVDNSALTFNLPGALAVSNIISGTGSLAVQAGTVALVANNSYGASSISSGATLQVGAGGSTGSLGAGSVNDGGALLFKRTGAVTNSGSISGGGSLAVQGSGTVALAANNSYAGPTTVDTGVLQVGVGGTSGTLGTAGSVTLTNHGTLAFSRSDTLTNLVSIIGTNGTLAQFGPGTLVITNDGNNWGPTLVTGGKLQVGDGSDTTGSLPPSSPVTVTGTGTLVFDRPDVITVSNVISGSGNVAYIGQTNVNIMVPNGLNTYSGTTIISNSTIVMVSTANSDVADQAVNQSGLGNSTVLVQGNSAIQLAGATIANGDPPGGNGAGNVINYINVPAGQTFTLWEAGRGTLTTTNSGAGTFNLGVQYVRGDVLSDWTAFTGLVNIITNSVNTNSQGSWDFRMSSANGFPQAKLHLGDLVSMYSRATANSLIPIGELTGSDTSSLRSSSGGGTSAGNNQTWVVGGLNTDFAYDGLLLDGNSFVKTGTGKWTLTGVNGFTGTMTVSNGVLAFGVSPLDGVTVGTIASASSIIVASPGVIDASGYSDNNLQVSTTLGGNGTVKGGVLDYGTIAPGFSTNLVGNLTISSNLVVYGIAQFKIDQNPSVVSDMITCTNVTITDGSTIMVTEISTNDLQTGATFKLFSTPVTANFANDNVSLPPYNLDGSITYVWTNRLAIDGTIVLLSGATQTENPNSPPIKFSVSGNTLSLSWPTNAGWTLQVQTNNLGAGLAPNPANWVNVPGSTSVTSTNITIDPAQPTVFYRLKY